MARGNLFKIGAPALPTKKICRPCPRFLVLSLEGGASIEQVKRHARHRSVNTTMQYLHQRRHLEENAGDYIKL